MDETVSLTTSKREPSEERMPSISFLYNMPMPPHHAKPKLFTLVFAKRAGHVLLGMKRRGFGVGKWNGFGGKVNSGEAVEQCAVRELEEECGVSVGRDELEYAGYAFYIHPDPDGPPNVSLVQVFGVAVRSEEFRESEEMSPRWFKLDEVPYDEMWPDARHWIPRVLSGREVRACFVYGNDEEITRMQVEEVVASST